MSRIMTVLLMSCLLNCGDTPKKHTHTESITITVTDKDSPDHKSQIEQKNCWERLPDKAKTGLFTAISAVISALLTGLLVNNANRC